MLSQVWRADERVGGRYEIVSRLAEGGLAEVWLARTQPVGSFSKEIAIKTMREEAARVPDLVELFRHEAAIAARLNHPNVVQVFDFGEANGRPFLAMEHIPGTTLRYAARRRESPEAPAWERAMSRPALVRVLAELCRGLHYAHTLTEDGRSLELVHNDISPENIMVSSGGAVKLIDFGAARVRTLGPASRFVGRFRYASPERLQGCSVDARSDVYAVGVILYEHLTGAKPFDGDEETVIRRVVRGEVREPGELAPVPEELGRITLTAMAHDPEARYPDAWALAEDLQRYLDRASAEGPKLDEEIVIGGRAPRAHLRLVSPVAPPPSVEAEAPPARPPGDLFGRGTVVPAPAGGGDVFAVLPSRRANADRVPEIRAKAPAPPSVPPASAQSAEAARWFDRGWDCLRRDDEQGGLAAWRQAVALDPAKRLYRTNLARLERRLGGERAEAGVDSLKEAT